MNITQPTRLTFWRFVFIATAGLIFRSANDLLVRARDLGVDLSASKSWMGLIAGLGVIGILSLLLFALTWSRYGEPILSLLEFPERAPRGLRWLGILLVVTALIGYTTVFMIPFMLRFFGGVLMARFLIFWFFSLLGMWGIKLLRRETSWFNALVGIILCQATLHLLLLYWPRVTSYPFAMGWSETSRFYYPSLFLSKKVYGQQYPWPILHPTLHLLLVPPYWFDAPLWVHRLWRVLLGYVFVVAAIPPLLKRLSIPSRPARWLIGLWMFLYL
ncbi:MAG TPA: hypothetical protein VKP08_03755, partial [Anaerolineales bacterium]|nr:hypothetical protein [Anaerolineales bacterium]